MATIDIRGVHYHFIRAGAGEPIVLLHGFTGRAETWAGLAPTFHELGFQTVAVDALGHGQTASPLDSDRYHAEQVVADLAELLDCLAIPRSVWLGYSMGARLALQFAATHPDRVSALILESGSPGIERPVEREARARADGELAVAIERDGIEAFVDRWERLPLFASHGRLGEAERALLRRSRLTNDPTGLANSLRGFGQGTQPYLGHRLRELAMPVCLIAGAEDEKYVRLAEEMADMVPTATVSVIAGCGHTPHIERPVEFGRIVAEFLRNGVERTTAP